jgi:uncharacterized membrane protein YdjX (TVP38/TMEM64 family)
MCTCLHVAYDCFHVLILQKESLESWIKQSYNKAPFLSKLMMYLQMFRLLEFRVIDMKLCE